MDASLDNCKNTYLFLLERLKKDFYNKFTKEELEKIEILYNKIKNSNEDNVCNYLINTAIPYYYLIKSNKNLCTVYYDIVDSIKEYLSYKKGIDKTYLDNLPSYFYIKLFKDIYNNPEYYKKFYKKLLD